jgi:alkylation response protein AidB-like acyl-CoA dehydrogenase
MSEPFDGALSEGQIAWRAEVRAFIDSNVDDKLLAEYSREHEQGRGPLVKDFYRRMAERGWNATTWPKGHGGLEMSSVNRLILMDELAYAGAPRLEYAAHNLAPILMRHGTTANQRMWLPKIRSGEINFALGYSEAEAGTDLANLRTSAVRDGDQWVINGEKTWNSRAHVSTHEWLLARTDPDLPRHRGLSIIIVPMDAPGIEIRPLWTWGDERTNQVFFSDVRVPADYLVGEQNAGWSYVIEALDSERAAIGISGDVRRVFDELVTYCASTRRAGALICDNPDVSMTLAELAAEVEIQRLMCFEIACRADNGENTTVDGTILKIWTSELRAKIADAAMSIQGMEGQLDSADPCAPSGGRAEAAYRWAPIHRFGGGANEVLRDIIGQRGLGLPRSARRLSA